jgi:hypothetical protein
MNELVDSVLRAYEPIWTLDPAKVTESRERIRQYVDKLVSAGQRDAHNLAEYAMAYLKELHEGPDPRFTGC